MYTDNIMSSSLSPHIEFERHTCEKERVPTGFAPTAASVREPNWPGAKGPRSQVSRPTETRSKK